VTVGRILAQDRDRGAGFPIKPGVVVTAAHTVRGSDAAQILFAPSGGSPVKVAEVELDEKLDRGFNQARRATCAARRRAPGVRHDALDHPGMAVVQPASTFAPPGSISEARLPMSSRRCRGLHWYPNYGRDPKCIGEHC
jgi:hypothetical protein